MRRGSAGAYEPQQRGELHVRIEIFESPQRQTLEQPRYGTASNAIFWWEDGGFYVLGLESNGRQLCVASSKPGHALWCGIASPERARSVVRRLAQRDMFSGWGIRTLSTNERRYNPAGYHLGSVWPHDNAIIAAGMKRYGFDDDALGLFSAIFDAASHFDEYRLPELFCGFSR